MERTGEVERLTEHGCSVLCLDCPEGMLFGIDYSAWTVGPRFMGVKLIPPGLHYMYCSASSEDVGVGRSGFFLFMRPREVEVFRWDPEMEELSRLENTDEEARYTDGVRGFDFDANLGPYPLELSTQWTELTRHVTRELLGRVEPVGRIVRSKRAEYDALTSTETAAAAKVEASEGTCQEESGDTDMDVRPQAPQSEERLETNQGGGGLFFSEVPRARKKAGATPAETTAMHLDRSAQLETMIAQTYGGEELCILGELQLAYIAFLLGQNYDGFEQWRALLQLLCSCESAVLSRPELFAELFRTFFTQLHQAPSDLFGDDLTKENFIGTCALSLIELCDFEAAAPKLRKRAEKLRELVQQKFGISTEDLALLGEDAPQIVDLDGRDLVNLSGPGLGNLD